MQTDELEAQPKRLKNKSHWLNGCFALKLIHLAPMYFRLIIPEHEDDLECLI